MLERQRYAIADGQSQLDRLAGDLFSAGEESGPEQIPRIVIKDYPAPIEIEGDERRANARTFEQSRIPPIFTVAGVGDETAL